MSKSLKKEHSFVDTDYLRDHVSKLREQKKIATKLYNNVVAMKNNSNPDIAYQYNSIIRDADQMIQYFNKMINILSDICDDTIQLSQEIGNIIDTDTERAQHIISESFML